jgi:hypothetical protein
VIQGLDIGLLPYIIVLGEEREIRPARVDRAADRRASPAKPDGRHGAGATSGWGITQALHGTSCALIHVPAQIDKRLVGIAYLDKSKARILKIDNHIRSHRQGNGEGDGVQHVQTTPYRHVVAREQRTRKSQCAEHREGNQRRMK